MYSQPAANEATPTINKRQSTAAARAKPATPATPNASTDGDEHGAADAGPSRPVGPAPRARIVGAALAVAVIVGVVGADLHRESRCQRAGEAPRDEAFPDLKIVFMESGFVWLPAFLWRANKTWRGVHSEIPWVKKPPADFVRDHVRLTVQPVDEPPDSKMLEQVLEQIGSDKMLLFSTDYPHWHFDGTDALPKAMTGDLAKKILVDNPLETYARLR